MIPYLLYKMVYFFVTRVPLRCGYAVSFFFSYLKFYLSPRDRRAVVSNLKIILSPSEYPKINTYAKGVFINFGKYLIEFFRLKYLKKEDLGRKVKVEGLEYVDGALEKGKGVIILTAHLGNWELGGVFMSLLGYPVIAVALPHRHARVNAFFNRQRERIGVEVVSSSGLALRRIFSALKDNKMVALVGDRDFANGGKKMPFLGREKTIPRGPALLAKRTGASIVPGFVIRQDDDTHVIKFLKPLNTERSEEEIITSCTRLIESMIRQYPSQWLIFREFWKE
jgi:KDO2-lipid IV(A) lauroyltransferase